MSVSLDRIPEPTSFWFEDAQNKKIEWDIYSCAFPPNWAEMHSKNLLVQHSIHFHNPKRKQDHLVVRFFKWVLSKLPQDWNAHRNLKFESSINHDYWLVKYLVEKRKFSFWQACVVISEMCGRCQSICEDEINNASNRVYENNACCQYCKFVDPGYLERRRVLMCYSAHKNNRDIKDTWEQSSRHI